MESEVAKGPVEDVRSMTSLIPFVFILSIIGFGCFLFFVLYSIASPVLAPLSFMPLDHSVWFRGISICALSITLFVASQISELVLRYCKAVFSAGALLALTPLVAGLAGHYAGVSELVLYISWAASGIGQGALALFWMTLFSSLPSRRSGLAIALGSCTGTFVFVLVALQPNPYIELLESCIFLAASAAIALYLSSKIVLNTSSFINTGDKLHISALPGYLSSATQGIVYGYTIIVLCTLGPLPVIIGVAMGILGDILSVFWTQMRLRLSFDVDDAIVQRIALPLIVIGVIGLPFMGEVGKTVCGSLVVAALAHSTIMLWSKAAIDNYEFQLNPIRMFALHQTADWLGFMIGTVIAYWLFFVQSTTEEMQFAGSAVLVIFVVIAFSVYGANEYKTRQHIEPLLAAHKNEDIGEDFKSDHQARFSMRCDKIIDKYGLTKREAEVFKLLAKGRNAKFIQYELFVSFSTAKTHIYHIYRKLDIGSQQNLIDIVDENRYG